MATQRGLQPGQVGKGEGGDVTLRFSDGSGWSCCGCEPRTDPEAAAAGRRGWPWPRAGDGVFELLCGGLDDAELVHLGAMQQDAGEAWARARGVARAACGSVGREGKGAHMISVPVRDLKVGDRHERPSGVVYTITHIERRDGDTFLVTLDPVPAQPTFTGWNEIEKRYKWHGYQIHEVMTPRPSDAPVMRVGDVVEWDKVPSGALVRSGPRVFLRIGDRGGLIKSIDGQWYGYGAGDDRWCHLEFLAHGEKATVLALGVDAHATREQLRDLADQSPVAEANSPIFVDSDAAPRGSVSRRNDAANWIEVRFYDDRGWTCCGDHFLSDGRDLWRHRWSWGDYSGKREILATGLTEAECREVAQMKEADALAWVARRNAKPCVTPGVWYRWDDVPENTIVRTGHGQDTKYIGVRRTVKGAWLLYADVAEDGPSDVTSNLRTGEWTWCGSTSSLLRYAMVLAPAGDADGMNERARVAAASELLADRWAAGPPDRLTRGS